MENLAQIFILLESCINRDLRCFTGYSQHTAEHNRKKSDISLLKCWDDYPALARVATGKRMPLHHYSALTGKKVRL